MDDKRRIRNSGEEEETKGGIQGERERGHNDTQTLLKINNDEIYDRLAV